MNTITRCVLTIVLTLPYLQQTHCMLTAKTFVPVKLDTAHKQDTTPFAASLSNTMYKKCLWKKKLAIKPDLSIVVTNIIPEELTAFTLAADAITQDNFFPFFNSIGERYQKLLISACGKDKLNSPLMTALVAQAYIPDAIIQTHIMPYMEKDRIENYMRCAMIIKNIQTPFLHFPFFGHTLMNVANGNIHKIPVLFFPHDTLCTANTYSHNIISGEENTNTVTYVRKKTDKGSYSIFSVNTNSDDQENCIGWQPKGQESSSFAALPPGIIKKAFCSPDGYYMTIKYAQNTDNMIFLHLDPSNDNNIITKKIILPDSLKYAATVHFDPTSTKLFCLSFTNETPERSQLVIYDIKQDKEHTTHFSTIHSQASFNNDCTRMIVREIFLTGDSRLHIWNLENILNIVPIETIDIFKSTMTIDLTYSTTANIVAARLYNGNILLIKELPSGKIKLSHIMNPHRHSEVPSYQSLLFSSDNKLLIDAHKFYRNANDNNNTHQLITLWDIEAEKYITHEDQMIHNATTPEIIMNTTENAFLIPLGKDYLWAEYPLYTQEEQATCKWVNNNNDLFMVYMLRRLLQAHKDNDNIIPEQANIIENVVQTIPNDFRFSTQSCIRQYLYKSAFEIMRLHAQEHANSLKETVAPYLEKLITFFK